MPLWGKTTSDESKPKYLTRGAASHDPQNCFATNQGWVLRHYKNAAKTKYWDEVLVSIDGLVGAGGSGTDTIGAATITAVFYEETSYAGGATGSVVVIYNERVDVTNGATLTVTVTGASNPTATAVFPVPAGPVQNVTSFSFMMLIYSV